MGSAFAKPDTATYNTINAAKVVTDTLRLAEELVLISETIGRDLLLVIEDINAAVTVVICGQIVIFVLLICIMVKLCKLTSICKKRVAGQH